MGFNREFCLCGVHVHTATRVIGIVFLSLAVLAFIGDITGYVRDRASASAVISGVLGNILACSVNLFLVFGNFKNRPNFYWPFIIFHILSVILCFIAAVLLMIFGSTLFGIVESLPKDLPQLEMPNQGSRSVFPFKDSSESYHAPKPFYGKGNLDYGKMSFYNHLNAQEEYHAARQFAETVGASLSALIIFGSILMMLFSTFYAYLIHVVIRGYRFLRSATDVTVYNKLADETRRFS